MYIFSCICIFLQPNKFSLLLGLKINIKIKSEVPMQVDGEPWMQQPCDLFIRPTVQQVKYFSIKMLLINILSLPVTFCPMLIHSY